MIEETSISFEIVDGVIVTKFLPFNIGVSIMSTKIVSPAKKSIASSTSVKKEVKPQAVAKKIAKPIIGTAKKIVTETKNAVAATERRGRGEGMAKTGKPSEPVKGALLAVKTQAVKLPSVPPTRITANQQKQMANVDAAKKEIAAKVAKPKAEKPPKEPKPLSPRAYILSLLLMRAYTDDEIHAGVMENFKDMPGVSAYALNRNYISMTRGDLNCGLIKKPWVDGLISQETGYMPRFIRDEKGDLITIQYSPSGSRRQPLQFAI